MASSPTAWMPSIAAGAMVRVVAGAFAGLEGICQPLSRDRVAVLSQVLGREVSTSVPRRDVVEVGPCPRS